MASVLLAVVLFLCASGARAAATNGPTLQFDYGRGKPQGNPVGKFMYFVPLISPEPVMVLTNAGNTQNARVLSFACRTNGAEFFVTCEFEFLGAGCQQSVFDHSPTLRRYAAMLQAGGLLKRQLASINVTGTGAGNVELEGVVTNGQRVVNLVQLRFNHAGHISPVTINLEDLAESNGTVLHENEMVARVNALTFRRAPGKAKMDVALASLKRKDAGDTIWQNFVGSLKGVTVNLFLPPLTVEPEGQQAMLDFGGALAQQNPTFTFPNAARLKGSGQSAP